MKVYIATGYNNKAEHNRVRDLLQAAGHTITYDWTQSPDGFANNDARAEEAERLYQGVRDADLVVVLLPGAIGTHFEFGAAVGLGKPVVLCDETAGAFRHEQYNCPFYLLAEVMPATDEVGLMRAVKSWEGP